MKMNKYIIMLFLLSLSCLLMADPTRDPWLVSLDNEFLDSEMTFAPIAAWESAGSNAIINPLTVIEIDISDIEPIVCLEPISSIIDTTSFVSAIPNDEMDDSAVFTALIEFINRRELNETGHVRILIPPGVYNFSDQIVMHSNISLKGAGSDLTELRFLIQSDPTSGTMTQDDCRKDAIRINGSGELPHQRIHSVGIEEVPEAVRDARANAEQNGIANARFITGKTEQLLAKAMQDFPADAIVLDPPRAGVEESALWAIRSANIHEILYLSCSPMSLARDLKILLTDGKYELASIAAFDMFPNTWHIECLAHLRLSK